MNFVTVLTILVCICKSFAHDADVHTIQYTVENFQEEIVKQNHFVMFYAPWCGHCKRLGPTWEELAEMLNQDVTNVLIAKVDCTTDGDVCNSNDVTGYPTLKFFKIGDKEGVKFRGTRDLPSLTTFINEQISLTSDGGDTIAVPEVGNGLVTLTESNFDSHIASGKHFVKFYAPWCGHCQKLAPVWEELAQNMGDDKMRVAKVDCTTDRAVCNQFDIKGYPTLLWIEDGKKVEKYQGQRGLEELKTYVQKMIGQDSDAEVKAADDGEGEAVMLLTGDSFEHGIEKGVSFIKFFAPWCGHCKRLAPTWEDLGKKFVGNDEVNIVKVDCTLEVNKELCNQQEVEGFPTVFLYKNGKKVSEYNGDRSLSDLFEFVNQHVGNRDEL